MSEARIYVERRTVKKIPGTLTLFLMIIPNTRMLPAFDMMINIQVHVQWSQHICLLVKQQ